MFGHDVWTCMMYGHDLVRHTKAVHARLAARQTRKNSVSGHCLPPYLACLTALPLPQHFKAAELVNLLHS
jgi:hypothetical protein